MSLKYINNNGEEVIIAGRGLSGKDGENGKDGTDGVPKGIILEYNGEEIPEGYIEVENPNPEISEITNGWAPVDPTTVAPSLGLLKGSIKVLGTSLNFSNQATGAAGYVSKSITIPDGYISCGAFFRTGQVSGSNGMQLTPVYGHALTTGTQTFYMNYYFPKGTGETVTVSIYVCCIKTELLTS